MQNDFQKRALHLFALSALAVTQPCFHILGKSGTFLVAHNFGPADLILLTLILMIGFPLFFIFLTFIADSWSKFLREGVFILIFVILAGLTALPFIKDISTYSGNILFILALLIGLVTYMIYHRLYAVKLFFSYLAPLVFFFPVNFLFNTDASKLLFPKVPEIPHTAQTLKKEHGIPIILIVLDEFPITSIMNEHGKIDSVLYPNFSKLSENSYWFRNATAVSEWTDLAVPAILTGRYPSGIRTKVPTAQDYPENLFTFLEPHYELKVFEELTKLCFNENCGNHQFSDSPGRTLRIYSDLLVLFGHSILPPDYSKNIPSIHNRWNNFNRKSRDENGNVYDDRMKRVENFTRSIYPKNKSTLYFLHLTLPHSPTIYLPSGKAYSEADNTIIGRDKDTDSWTLDNWQVTQAYQRHLLQVGYTDKVIGNILDHLKDSGIYDEAMLVVTADHGISFLPGERARGYTQFNYSDILSVPLFIKLPHQKEGTLRKDPVQVIDIFPAIAATLGLKVPWPIDGKNPFKENPENDRDQKLAEQAKIYNTPHLEILRFPNNTFNKYKALKKKYLLFGSGSREHLYSIGPAKNLLGLNTEDALKNKWISPAKVDLDSTKTVIQIDKNTNYVPSWITGTLLDWEPPHHSFPKSLDPSWLTSEPVKFQTGNGKHTQPLAIAVNGVIQATTQINRFSESSRFAALIPEKAFREGANKISVFKIIQGENSNPASIKADRRFPRYQPDNPSYIWNRHKPRYTLVQGTGQSIFLMNSDGKRRKIPKIKAGYVEVVRYSPEAMYFFGFIKGWHDRRNEVPFMIFSNNRLVFADKLLLPRPPTGNPNDIVKVAFRIPVYQNKKIDLNNILVVLSDEKGNFQEMGIAPKVLAYPNDRIPRHRFYGAFSYCQNQELWDPIQKVVTITSSNYSSSECF